MTPKPLLLLAVGAAVARLCLSQDADTYAVIDLSGGWSAAHYPISYCAQPPAGGWTSDHKTNALVLRKIVEPDASVYYIGVFEVTRGQWERVLGVPFTPADSPISGRSYANMESFAETLKNRTGFLVSLPTEERWEYACRAGTTNLYHYGTDDPADLATYAWFLENSDSLPHAVGTKQPNPWGLYDLYGNVAELCLGSEPPLRGGHFNSAALSCSSSSRSTEDEFSPKIGFRICAKPYKLTVNGGLGGGLYLSGAGVSVLATNTVQSPFVTWIVAPPSPESDLGAAFVATNPATSLTMPACDVTLTAACASDFHTLTVYGGSGGGNYLAGKAVVITADPPLSNMVFDRWSGAVTHVQSITSATTTVTMPAFDVSVRATYSQENEASSFDFTFATNNGTITITRYIGGGGAVAIPCTINTFPVTCIGSNAFSSCTNVTSVTIPDSVCSIREDAFDGCSRLTAVTLGHGLCDIGAWAFSQCPFRYVTIPGSVTNIGFNAFYKCSNLLGLFFEAAPPSLGARAFTGSQATVYYLPEASGWQSTFGFQPTLLWNPAAQPDASFGVSAGRFGFTIAGTTNIPIVVEACTNLSSADWTPVETNTLGTSGSLFFSDSASSNCPARFYRIVWP